MLSDRDGEMGSNLRCVWKGKKDRPLWLSSVWEEETKWKNDIKKAWIST